MASYQITKNETKTIGGDKDLTVNKNASTTINGYYKILAGNYYQLDANKNINITSKFGNIELLTQGEFEIIDKATGQISSNGYNNLGTCGNIKITSTFGNIRN